MGSSYKTRKLAASNNRRRVRVMTSVIGCWITGSAGVPPVKPKVCRWKLDIRITKPKAAIGPVKSWRRPKPPLHDAVSLPRLNATNGRVPQAPCLDATCVAQMDVLNKGNHPCHRTWRTPVSFSEQIRLGSGGPNVAKRHFGFGRGTLVKASVSLKTGTTRAV